MSTTAVIGFGILAWVLLAIPVALFVARMIKLRDRQRPDRIEPGTPAKCKPAADPESSFHARSGWHPRNKT
ncbi:MAG: hypothetical protein ACRDTH_15695 [Pseudonocardiaceae bacterium]